jgi:hypothetical protein
MADPRDLTDLATLKAFLVPVSTTSSSDLVLAQFITAISNQVHEFLSRKLLVESYVELRNGNDRRSIRTKHWPIISVSAVVVDGYTVQPAIGPTGPGYVFDDKYIQLRNGYTGGSGYGSSGTFGYRGGCGPGVNYGVKNVSLSYVAGYITPGQLAISNLPTWEAATSTPIGMQILPGNGYFYNCITAGTTGSAQPTFPTVIGQTVNDNGVVWLAQGAYTTPPPGALLLPPDLTTGTLEQAAYHFVSRARVGVTSIGEGPQRVGLLVRDIAPLAKTLLMPYKQVVPIGDWS